MSRDKNELFELGANDSARAFLFFQPCNNVISVALHDKTVMSCEECHNGEHEVFMPFEQIAPLIDWLHDAVASQKRKCQCRVCKEIRKK